GNNPASSAASVSSSGSGQLSPVAWKRLIVVRTVRCRHSNPASNLTGRYATNNFNRRTSRTWRMVVLSAGIRSLLWIAKGADLSRLAEAPHPGRHHPGRVGDIISERRARSSRNDGRLHPESALEPPNLRLAGPP